jgi:spermidine synthase
MRNHYTNLKIVAFLSGAIIMVLEIIGFRILAPYFGYSVYVSGSLIGIVMAALSLGYYFGGKLADRKPKKHLLYHLLLLADIYVIIISFFYVYLLRSFSSFGVIYGSITSAVVLFAPSMTLLGMIPPFIIRLMTKDPSVVGSIAGDITAIGTVGSIIGTFGATFFLIPRFGSHWTLYVCSLVLLLLAVWGLAVERKRFAILLCMIFVFNIFPRGSSPNVIYQKESPYNLVKVTKEPDGRFYLKLNSDILFHSVYKPGSELVNEYYDYMNLAAVIADAKEILVLGMGAGTSVRQFLHYFDANIDAVEIDPVVVDIGKKYFGLKETGRLHLFAKDARPFLRNSNKLYDVIEIDVYHGGVYAPFYILTKEFFQSVYDHLTPNGIMVINVLSPYQPENRLLLVNAVGKTISTVFPSVYKIEMFLNHVLFAPRSGTDLQTIRARLKSYNGHPELYDTIIAALQALSPLYINKDEIVLTDDKAPVAEITYRMVSSGRMDAHVLH